MDGGVTQDLQSKQRQRLLIPAVVVPSLVLCTGAATLLPNPVVTVDARWTGDALEQLDSQVEEQAEKFRRMDAQFRKLQLSDTLRQRARENTEKARRWIVLQLIWCTNANAALRKIRNDRMQPTVIILVECDVTDSGLRYLADHRQLHLIKIMGCPGVSRGGLSRLRSQLPDTRFSVWSSGRSRDISFYDDE